MFTHSITYLLIIHAEHVVHRRGYCFHFGCMYVYLRAVGRKVLWSSACVCLSVCVCALFLSARYLKNGFMDHHQIWWVGAGGEPLEEV